MAADNAALAGVIVVASAGNAGDTYFISGSPGSGGRVIATAGVVDDGQAAPALRVNAPAGIAGFYVAGTAAFGNVWPGADKRIGCAARRQLIIECRLQDFVPQLGEHPGDLVQQVVAVRA